MAMTLAQLLDQDTAAEILNTHTNTLANWRVRGVGPRFVKVGRAVKYDPADLKSWIEARKVSSTSEPAKAA
jgi:hypothetical protein